MTKNHILQTDYTQYEHEYQLKLPIDLDVCIPTDDCVRLIRQFVEELDLTELYDTYERLPSGNHPTPDILIKLLLYAYHERKEIASREMEQRCKRDINYLYLLEGKQRPIILPLPDSGPTILGPAQSPCFPRWQNSCTAWEKSPKPSAS